MMPLDGKVALVTGSARGIGRAIALKLAEQGADVIVNYITSHAAAEELVAEIKKKGPRSIAVKADVGKTEEIRSLFDAIRSTFGGLDILINNAIDVAAFGPTMRLRVDAWRHTAIGQATTLLLCAQESAKLMKGRGGKIVSITSLGSQRYIPGYAPIGVAKAAVEALTRYLGVELARENINVNAICGGPIETDGLKLFGNFEQIKQTSISRTPAGRLGTVDDIADVVVFFCSDAARWICGQTIVVDGGLSLIG
jgi:enoyl-[acyl-carrier protein] reductase III